MKISEHMYVISKNGTYSFLLTLAVMSLAAAYVTLIVFKCFTLIFMIMYYLRVLCESNNYHVCSCILKSTINIRYIRNKQGKIVSGFRNKIWQIVFFCTKLKYFPLKGGNSRQMYLVIIKSECRLLNHYNLCSSANYDK
jgi:hypothetical protein